MGPCKRKWTDEEEAAIKDGISKHGVGKWSYILKDPEFSGRLFARSNVDLKDKWRNMQFAMNGGSRNRHKSVQKDCKRTSTHCDKSVALISEACDEDKVAEPEAPSLINEASQNGGFVKLTRCRFDDRKLEGLTNVKQASSSTQIQVQHGVEYELADSNSLRAELDAELMRIAQMSPEEAAAAAAAAVEKAEAAITEAEAAEKEAVEAESIAEEAEAFAEKLRKKLMEKKAAPAPKRGKLARSKC